MAGSNRAGDAHNAAKLSAAPGREAAAADATAGPGGVPPKASPRTLSQSEFVRDLRGHCSAVATAKQKIYVKDRSGLTYLTLDRTNQYPDGAIVDVSVQSFRDHFSRFSSLIKNGLRFRLTRRGSPPVYAHRHARYHDPLDAVVEKWRRQVETVAMYLYQNRLAADASPADRRLELRRIVHSVAGMTIGEGANGYLVSRAEQDIDERG